MIDDSPRQRKITGTKNDPQGRLTLKEETYEGAQSLTREGEAVLTLLAKSNPTSTRGVRKSASRRVCDSPSAAFLAPPQATNHVEMMHASRPQEGEEQTLHRHLKFLRKSTKRKDVIGTHLSPALHGQPPSAPSLDRRADLCIYF